MPRHIALLRGINVGGHRVKMDRLRELFEELGFSDVATFIASGNVVFESPSTDAGALEDRIAAYLEAALGWGVATFIRSPAELRRVADRGPFGGEEPRDHTHSHYVVFLRDPPDRALRAAVGGLESGMDRFGFGEREIHWLIGGKLTESPHFGGGIDRVLRHVPNTMRNVTTLRRLVAKHGQ